MIGVVIVTYNRPELLKGCLRSLGNQTYTGSYEVTVVDNGSTVPVEVTAAEYPFKLKLIRNKQRLRLSACKHRGFKESTAEMIAFIDDDCSAAPDWLAGIAETLTAADVAAGVVVAAPDTPLPRRWRASLNWLIGINPAPDEKYPPLGSNIAFRRTVLEKISLEPPPPVDAPEQYLPYGEDNDRLAAALQEGFSLSIKTGMIVYHYVPAERRAFPALVKRSFNEGRALASGRPSFPCFLRSLFLIPAYCVLLVLSFDPDRFFRAIMHTGCALTCLARAFFSLSRR